MSLPIQTNATCDIYRNGNAPPAAPDVAAVAGLLVPDWRRGQEAGDRGSPWLSWTHVLLVGPTVDIRDLYTGTAGSAAQDMVYIPDQNGTPFLVTFIELVQRGSPDVHKRVYLDRQTPTWPTDEL